MKPFIVAPGNPDPYEVYPGGLIRFSFSAPTGTYIIHQIVLAGVGRRRYRLSFATYEGFAFVPVFMAELRKAHGWRTPDDRDPIVWTGRQAEVTVENLGKSPCLVSCVLKGWKA